MITITFDAANAVVKGFSQEALKRIKTACSYTDKGIEFANRNSQWRRSPIVSLFNHKTNSFPTGLLPKVCEALKPEKVTVINNIPAINIQKYKLPDFLYLHQREAIERCCNHRRGLIQSPTGSGKSYMMMYLINALLPSLPNEGCEVLIAVPTKELLDDFHSNLERILNTKVGKVGNGKKLYYQVTVGIINSLATSNQDFSKVKVLLIDEAHRAGSLMYKNLGQRCFNSDIRIGFSGTCWRDGDELELEANIGSIIYNVEQSSLHHLGVLHKPSYITITIPENNNPYPSAKNIPCKGTTCIYPTLTQKPDLIEVYNREVIYNSIRNEAIINCLKSFLVSQRTGSALVLVKNILHGDELHKLGKKKGLVVPFIKGQSKDRGEVLSGLRDGSIPAAITTRIFNEGTDIKSLELLIIASGGKSAINVTQQAGRVIRVAENKHRSFIIDFDDPDPFYLRWHSQERKHVLSDLYGFPTSFKLENIKEIFNAS